MPITTSAHQELLPRTDGITEYDRANFLIYARILDAVRFNQPWATAASEILRLDVANDEAGAFRIWCDHVDRAEWIVGPGLSLIVQNQKIVDHLVH